MLEVEYLVNNFDNFLHGIIVNLYIKNSDHIIMAYFYIMVQWSNAHLDMCLLTHYQTYFDFKFRGTFDAIMTYYLREVTISSKCKEDDKNSWC